MGLKNSRVKDEFLMFVQAIHLAGHGRDARFRKSVIRDVNPVSRVVKKARVIFAPNDAMRKIHRYFLGFLNHWIDHKKLGKMLFNATGSLPRCNPKANVIIHSRSRFFYLLDLRSAFPSVNVQGLSNAICFLIDGLSECEAELLEFLGQYFVSREEGLFTGGPAANDLFNLYVGHLMDEPLSLVAEANGLTYTRYVDDLTFSGNDPVSMSTRREIRTVISDAGFGISDHKAKLLDIEKGPVFVNGIGIKNGGRLFVPRAYVNHLEGLIQRAMRRGDISPSVVHGKMGVFLHITPAHHMNASELRLLERYREFCAQQES